MRIHLIVTKYAEQEPCIEDAWDEYSIDENHEGYLAALDKVKREAASQTTGKGPKAETRVGIVTVPDTFFDSLFEPREVEGKPCPK